MKVPKAFFNERELKAFVLGCDPTAFGKHQGFEVVFDIGGDKRYFARTLDNLMILGLSLDYIYVQNLVTDYQKEETGKNKDWKQIAKGYVSGRKMEFDKIDSTCSIPVFLTSELLYKVLITSDRPHTARDLYTKEGLVPIKANDNKLGRPLIPLFRHRNYNLSKQIEYEKRVSLYLAKK